MKRAPNRSGGKELAGEPADKGQQDQPECSREEFLADIRRVIEACYPDRRPRLVVELSSTYDSKGSVDLNDLDLTPEVRDAVELAIIRREAEKFADGIRFDDDEEDG